MQLTFNDSFIEELFRASGKAKPGLVKAVADRIIATTDPLTVARYLLDRDTAVSLLAARLEVNARKVLSDLGNGASAAASAPSRAAAKGGKKSAAGTRRQRITPEELKRIKTAVVTYLKRHPDGSPRQLIVAAAGLGPRGAHIYNRVMRELQKEKLVRARGTRRTAVYVAV